MKLVITASFRDYSMGKLAPALLLGGAACQPYAGQNYALVSLCAHPLPLILARLSSHLVAMPRQTSWMPHPAASLHPLLVAVARAGHATPFVHITITPLSGTRAVGPRAWTASIPTEGRSVPGGVAPGVVSVNPIVSLSPHGERAVTGPTLTIIPAGMPGSDTLSVTVPCPPAMA